MSRRHHSQSDGDGTLLYAALIVGAVAVAVVVYWRTSDGGPGLVPAASPPTPGGAKTPGTGPAPPAPPAPSGRPLAGDVDDVMAQLQRLQPKLAELHGRLRWEPVGVRRTLAEGMLRGLNLPLPVAADELPQGMEFVYVPPGEFLMGRTDDEKRVANLMTNGLDAESSAPQVRVRVREGFFLGRYEVTRGQYHSFARATWNQRSPKERPAWFDAALRDPDLPAGGLSWGEAAAFARWVADGAKLPVRLPTEVEWEYAARGPGGTRFPRADGQDFRPPADGPARVGQTPGDRSWCGAADLCGNLAEWCGDVFQEYEYRAMKEKADAAKGVYEYSPTRPPPRPANQPDARVVRGGSFGGSAVAAEAASRHKRFETDKPANVGLRLVVSVPADFLPAPEPSRP